MVFLRFKMHEASEFRDYTGLVKAKCLQTKFMVRVIGVGLCGAGVLVVLQRLVWGFSCPPNWRLGRPAARRTVKATNSFGCAAWLAAVSTPNLYVAWGQRYIWCKSLVTPSHLTRSLLPCILNIQRDRVIVTYVNTIKKLISSGQGCMSAVSSNGNYGWYAS